MGITRIAVTCLAILLLTAVRLQAQDTLAAARELYASAEYDNALKLLDRLAVETPSSDDQQSIDLYRSLCLLAVGRHDDAARSIESIIARDPSYQPGEDVSPRMRNVFSDVRKRMLPTIVQQQYAEAKGAFERKEFDAAASGFKRVVEALNDPDMGAAANRPPLADLQTLAAGFYDLSVKAVPPLPPSPAPPPSPSAAAAPAAPTSPVSVSLPPKIYTGEEQNVVPPQTLVQTMPKYPGAVPSRGATGVVEVVINESGGVESAAMLVPVTASYDKQVVTAATRWLYVPAMVNGTPVKFRKRIQITVTPPTP